MKFLVSRMADLKLRLLDAIVRDRNSTQVTDACSNERLESDKMTVCRAVEDRICKRIDLASRTDLTDRQAMDALRLLLKIVRKSGLPVDFSASELFMLTQGIQYGSGQVPAYSTQARKSSVSGRAARLG
jgi:hypothetical protein